MTIMEAERLLLFLSTLSLFVFSSTLFALLREGKAATVLDDGQNLPLGAATILRRRGSAKGRSHKIVYCRIIVVFSAAHPHYFSAD